MPKRKTPTMYGNNYKPCPYAKIKQERHPGYIYHIAYCCKSGTPERVYDENVGVMCVGRNIGGKTYRNCPKYKSMKKSSDKDKKKAKRAIGKKQVSYTFEFADLLKWVFIGVTVLACLKALASM